MAPSAYSNEHVTLDNSSSDSLIADYQKRRRRPSILKSDLLDEQFISTNRDCWLCLPVPRLSSSPQKSSNSSPSSDDECSEERTLRRKSVTFNEIHLRVYDQTLGDHPFTSEGPPIALDWSYHDAGVYTLEEYESDSSLCSTGSEVQRLSKQTRKLILVRCYGFQLAELRRARRSIRRKAFLPKIERKVERVIECIGHRTRNILKI